MTSQMQQQSSRLDLALNGQIRVDYITDTDTYTGKWCKIETMTETVFNSLLQSRVYVNGVLTADIKTAAGTVAASKELYGNFTTIDLTSGSVRAYSLEQ